MFCHSRNGGGHFLQRLTVYFFRLSCACATFLGNVFKARNLGAGVQGNSRVPNVTARSNPRVSDYQLNINHGFTVNAGAHDASHQAGFSGGGWKRVVAAVVCLIEAFSDAVVGSTLELSFATCVGVAVTLAQLQT